MTNTERIQANNEELREAIEMAENLPEAGGVADPVIEPLEITENGTYTAPDGVDGYSPITVDVPITDGYIVPSGTKEITENGTHDVTEYASVNVNVEASGGNIIVSDINLHDISTDKSNVYLKGDNEVAYDGWDATDYIPVREDRSYLIYSTSQISGQYCNKYNSSKTRIGELNSPCNSTVKIAPLLYPGFDGYLRFSGTRRQIADLAVFEANALALDVSG